MRQSPDIGISFGFFSRSSRRVFPVYLHRALKKSLSGKNVVSTIKITGTAVLFREKFTNTTKNSKRDRAIAPTSKKTGRPPPPVCPSVKKPVGPIDLNNRSGRPHLLQCQNLRFHWMLRRHGMIDPIVLNDRPDRPILIIGRGYPLP